MADLWNWLAGERRPAGETRGVREGPSHRFIEAIAVGACVLDVEGRIDAVNERMATLLGYAPAEMQGQPLSVVLTAETRAQVRLYLERCREGVQIQQIHRASGHLNLGL